MKFRLGLAVKWALQKLELLEIPECSGGWISWVEGWELFFNLKSNPVDGRNPAPVER